MRRPSVKPYLYLLIPLFIVLSLPMSGAESIRAIALSAVAPPIEGIGSLFRKEKMTIREENRALKCENQLLVKEVLRLQHLLRHEEELVAKFGDKVLSSAHQKDLTLELESTLLSIPASVVMRLESSWTDTLWIRVGERDNRALGRVVVEKNSPVVVGDAILGVVDYVGEQRSSVKLLGAKSFNPSVRAVRWLDGHPVFLAKGELEGLAEVQMKRVAPLLKGTGFNYDFPDDEGPARDLRTGEVSKAKGAALSILEVGDLLVTSGMDGIFPKGFKVARVTKIRPLKEGDYYYDVEAEAVVDDFDSLEVVYVLPPV